jgi:hypothetical protein
MLNPQLVSVDVKLSGELIGPRTKPGKNNSLFSRQRSSMGLQYVLSIFGRILSDRPLSSAWRMTGKPEVMPPGWQNAPDKRPCVD